jgi:hypothetical protein
LAASTTLTDGQRVMRARLAAHESWANTPDRSARTAAGHKASPASVDYWLDRVDPDRTMSPEARRQAAEAKRNAHMARLAFKASRTRQARKSVPDEAA